MPEKSEISQAKETVFRLFRYRPRSEKEIIDKLRAKNIAPEIVTDVIAYFRKIQLLDDRLFARGWIASRLRKPFGLYRIKQELKIKGVPENIIQQECAQALIHYDEKEALKGLCQKRIKQYKHLPKLKARRRLYAYLARRGFSAETIGPVIKDI